MNMTMGHLVQSQSVAFVFKKTLAARVDVGSKHIGNNHTHCTT